MMTDPSLTAREPAGCGVAFPGPARPWPVWTAGMVVAAVAVYALGEGGMALLQYDRTAILRGYLYPLLTQHWTHWSVDHLVWDVAVFGVLGTLCELRDRPRYLGGVGLSAVAISVGLMVFMPGLRICRGLSGIDSALFGLLVAGWLQRGGLLRGVASALAILFLGKCLVEQVSGATLFVDAATAGMVPVPLTHGIGFVCGVFTAWLGAGPRASAAAAMLQLRHSEVPA